MTRRATATAFGKLNLYLAVGQVRRDGYHPLSTVFHSVALPETVVATDAEPETAGEAFAAVADGGVAHPAVSVEVTGRGADQVPVDAGNLAVRAALALAERTGRGRAVRLAIRKTVPVAGGMAGGSADAAATLLALNELWGTDLDGAQLMRLAATLGADVPFTVMGGTAVGRGVGDVLEPVPVAGPLHWVVALSARGLSTADVFREFDAQDSRGAGRRAVGVPAGEPGSARQVDAMVSALADGDLAGIARLMRNDLEPAAVALRPDLADTLAQMRRGGALAAMVSGSGPTVVGLAVDAADAARVAAAVTSAGVADQVLVTRSAEGGGR